jgi:hypothetical protein
VRLERLPSAATASAASSASDAGTGPQRPGSQRPGTVSAADEHHRHPDPHDSQLFTGSIEAIQRSKAFSGPGEDVFEDRDNAIASQN